MKRRHLVAGFVAVTTAIGTAGVGADMARAADDSGSVRLSNSGRTAMAGHSMLRTAGSAGVLTGVDLILQVPLRNQARLNRLVAAGTVITPAQYSAQFGASTASLTKVAKWAKARGMKVTATSAATGTVSVTAPVGKVNAAFSLKMQKVKLGSRAGLAPSADPRVPKSLGVTGIVGLTTVSDRGTGPERTVRSSISLTGSNRTKLATASGCATYWGSKLAVSAKKWSNMSNVQCALSPQKLVKTYNASAAAKVTPKVGILLWDNDKSAKANANLIADYYKYPKLTTYVDRSVTAGSQAQCGGRDFAEQNMDVQTTHAVAPKASIYYYGAKDCSDASLISIFAKAVKDHQVSTLSMSWGGSESGTTASFKQQYNRLAAQASLTGISLFASSGDMGDDSIQEGDTAPSQAKSVSFPASSPYFTAVGGTAVGLKSNGTRAFTQGWSNTLWSQPKGNSTSGITRLGFESNSVGAGGGISKDFAQPTWQKGKVTGSTTKRAVPDVAALADPATGAAFTPDGEYVYSAGGTSQASPLVAALVASSKAITKRKVGNAAPYFYKLGSSSILDVNGKANTTGAVLGKADDGTYELEGINAPADSLRTKAKWDNVTGVGEPAGTGFLKAFGS